MSVSRLNAEAAPHAQHGLSSVPGPMRLNSSSIKTVLRYVAFSTVVLVVFLGLMEGGVRVFFFVKNKIYKQERSFSEYLGWRTDPHVSMTHDVKGYGTITYSTDKYGFRVFGSVDSGKIKIFVIGDSYTAGHTVPDGKPYYQFPESQRDGVEVFAYGGGGYGTLQELMILDRYIGEIRPDIILWQFCSNDIINNSVELESASRMNNNQMKRPYYEDGRIEWLFPTQYRGWLDGLLKSSYLLRFINIRCNIFASERIGSIEDEWSPEHPLYRKSIHTTSELMGLVKDRAGNVPVVAFSVDAEDLFEEICRKNAIAFIKGVNAAVSQAKSSGRTVDGTPYDAHWNALGHSIAGKVIYEYLDENGYLNRKAPERRNRPQLPYNDVLGPYRPDPPAGRPTPETWQVSGINYENAESSGSFQKTQRRKK